jgi:K(+)-stimulated pyrophosphate-energized sodium pump
MRRRRSRRHRADHLITEYYTGTENRPVKSIAAASVSGHGTNVIQGLAIDGIDRSSALVIIAGILITYSLAGLFGIAIATTRCWRWPDDRGARRVRSGHRQCRRHRRNGWPAKGSPLRKATDAPDAVGNTTKAVTKGAAIARRSRRRCCCGLQ